MKKIFALVPFMDRSDEEIMAIREDVLATYIERSGVDAELSLPHGKRLTGDIEAMFNADIVVSSKYANYDPVCQVVHFAAQMYGKEVVEDRFVTRDPDAPDAEEDAISHDGVDESADELEDEWQE